MEDYSLQILYRSAIVGIGDIRCSAGSSGWSRDKWSSAHKIVFPRSGSFAISSRGRHAYIDPTGILFLNRDEEYLTSHPVPGGDRCSAFVLDRRVLSEIRGPYDPSILDNPDKPFPFTTQRGTAADYLMHRALLQCLPADAPCDQVAVDELALELANLVIGFAYARIGKHSNRGKRSTTESHASLVRRVKVLLASEFRGPLSIEGIARSAHSSPYHLCRIFKKETGVSVHQYLTRLRLRTSLEMIGDGDLTRVALDLGFSSHSHFSDAFRREFGISPSRMRRISSLKTIRELSKNLIARPTRQL